MDNILISGKNNEHFENLDNVLVIVIKCSFMACEVTYPGFRIDQKGVNFFQKK